MSAAAILKLSQLQQVYNLLASSLVSPGALSPNKEHMMVSIQQLKTAMQLAAQVNALLQLVSTSNITCDQVNAFVPEDSLEQRRAFCGTLLLDGKKKCVMKEKVCRAASEGAAVVEVTRVTEAPGEAPGMVIAEEVIAIAKAAPPPPPEPVLPPPVPEPARFVRAAEVRAAARQGILREAAGRSREKRRVERADMARQMAMERDMARARLVRTEEVRAAARQGILREAAGRSREKRRLRAELARQMAKEHDMTPAATPERLEEAVELTQQERERLLAAARDAQAAEPPEFESLPDLAGKTVGFLPGYTEVYDTYFTFASEDDAKKAAKYIDELELELGMPHEQIDQLFELMQQAKEKGTTFDTLFEGLANKADVTEDQKTAMEELYKVTPKHIKNTEADVDLIIERFYEYYPALQNNAEVKQLFAKLKFQITGYSVLNPQLDVRGLQRLVMFQDIKHYQLETTFYKNTQLPLLKQLQKIMAANVPELESPARLVNEAVSAGVLDFEHAKEEALKQMEPPSGELVKFDTKPAAALPGLSGRAADAAEELVKTNKQLVDRVYESNAELQSFESAVNAFVQDNLGVQLQGGAFLSQTTAQASAAQKDAKQTLRAASEFYAAAKERQLLVNEIAILYALLVELAGRYLQRAELTLRGGQGEFSNFDVAGLNVTAPASPGFTDAAPGFFDVGESPAVEWEGSAMPGATVTVAPLPAAPFTPEGTAPAAAEAANVRLAIGPPAAAAAAFLPPQLPEQATLGGTPNEFAPGSVLVANPNAQLMLPAPPGMTPAPGVTQTPQVPFGVQDIGRAGTYSAQVPAAAAAAAPEMSPLPQVAYGVQDVARAGTYSVQAPAAAAPEMTPTLQVPYGVQDIGRAGTYSAQVPARPVQPADSMLPTAALGAAGLVAVVAIVYLGYKGYEKLKQYQAQKSAQPDDKLDEDVLQKLLAKLNTLVDNLNVIDNLMDEAEKNLKSPFKELKPRMLQQVNSMIRDIMLKHLQVIITFAMTLDAAGKDPNMQLARIQQEAVMDFDLNGLQVLSEIAEPKADESEAVQQFRAKYLMRYTSYFKNMLMSERHRLIVAIVDISKTGKDASEKVAAIRNATGAAIVRLDQRMNKVFELLRSQIKQSSFVGWVKQSLWGARKKPVTASTLSTMDPVELIMLEPADMAGVDDVPCQQINDHFPVHLAGDVPAETDVTRRREMCVAMLKDGQPKCRFYDPLAQCMTPEEYDEVLRTVTKQLDKADEEHEGGAYGNLLGTITERAVAGMEAVAELGKKAQAAATLVEFADELPPELKKRMKKAAGELQQQVQAQVDELDDIGKKVAKDVAEAVVVAGAKYALRKVASKVTGFVAAPFRWAYKNPVRTALIVGALIMLYRNGGLDAATFQQIKAYLPGVKDMTWENFGKLSTSAKASLNDLLKFYDALTLENVLKAAVNAKQQAFSQAANQYGSAVNEAAVLYSNATAYMNSAFTPFSQYFNLSSLNINNVTAKAAEMNGTTTGIPNASEAATGSIGAYLSSLYDSVVLTLKGATSDIGVPAIVPSPKARAIFKGLVELSKEKDYITIPYSVRKYDLNKDGKVSLAEFALGFKE